MAKFIEEYAFAYAIYIFSLITDNASYKYRSKCFSGASKKRKKSIGKAEAKSIYFALGPLLFKAFTGALFSA